MTDFDDFNGQDVFEYGVNYPVVSNPQSVSMVGA